MSELGDALRRHQTPGGEEVPTRVVVAAMEAVADRAGPSRRPRWLSGPVAIAAALVVGVPVGYAVAEGLDGGGQPSPEVQMIREADAMEAAIDAMWLDAAMRAEAGELNADVDQEKAAATLRAAVDPPKDTEAANRLEDEMIVLTEKLRASGDLPPIGGDFAATWGQIPTSVLGSLQVGRPVGIDPGSCPGVVEAFVEAGVEPPTVYAESCPDAEELRRDIESFRELDARADSLRGSHGEPNSR